MMPIATVQRVLRTAVLHSLGSGLTTRMFYSASMYKARGSSRFNLAPFNLRLPQWFKDFLNPGHQARA
jgi:hypothetical protein